MNTWGVVVAGGRGNRYGRLKQFDPLAGRRVVDWSLDALRPVCEGLVLVVPSQLAADDHLGGPGVTVVAGGESRSSSVRSGLASLDPAATHVLVHDAARPLASPALVDRVVAALASGARGVVPVVGVTDSLRTIDGRPADRSQLVAVQTPQGFDVPTLRRAHASGADETDDAGLLYALGVEVAHVDGERNNLKLTTPDDLVVAEALMTVMSR
ncbi:MAG: 2-C-methyl-D-erythritol 4-phosphate cytidylyltransferase [Acidimicrobiales bacterium]